MELFAAARAESGALNGSLIRAYGGEPGAAREELRPSLAGGWLQAQGLVHQGMEPKGLTLVAGLQSTSASMSSI